MFKKIIAAWDKFFAWCAWAFSEAWRAVNALFAKAWAVVLSCIAALYELWEWMTEAITTVIAVIDGIVFPAAAQAGAPGAILTVLNICNTFLPLQELFNFLVAYMALYAVVMTYRLIKSWIPTLS